MLKQRAAAVGLPWCFANFRSEKLFVAEMVKESSVWKPRPPRKPPEPAYTPLEPAIRAAISTLFFETNDF